MLKMFKMKFIAGILCSLAFFAGTDSAKAAFTLTATGNSGPGTPFFFSTPITSNFGPATNLNGGTFPGDPSSPTLVMTWDITNIPASGILNINFLNLAYNGGPAGPIDVTVTVTEDAATIGTGAPGPYYGSVFGNAAGGAGSDTAFISGTATMGTTTFQTFNGPANFPSPGFLNINGSAIINSTGGPQTLSQSYRFTIGDFEAVSLFGTSGAATVTPAPAAALVGLFAVPTLAMLRRRIRK
jgi:hypothetical protein